MPCILMGNESKVDTKVRKNEGLRGTIQYIYTILYLYTEPSFNDEFKSAVFLIDGTEV